MKTIKIKNFELKNYKIEIKELIESVETDDSGTNKTIGYIAEFTKYEGLSKTMWSVEAKTMKKLFRLIRKELLK